MESLRVLIQKHIYRIADGLKGELYKSNIGENSYLENSILDDVSKVHGHIIKALRDIRSEGRDVRKYDNKIEEYFQIEDEIRVGNGVDIVDSKE